jgi:hypothetical protein
MNLLEVPERKKKFYLPSHLGECDGRQYAEMGALLYKLDTGAMDYPTFRVHALYALLNMKATTHQNQAVQEEKASNIFQLSHLVDEFFEEVDDRPVLKQYYTHNHTKVITPMMFAYHGPEDNFENVPFGAYVDGLNYFQEYHQTKDIQFLYLLMATFYKKKGAEHTAETVKKLAKQLQNYDLGKVYGFFLYFASFQKYLVSSKVYYMGNELDLSILFEGDGKQYTSSGLPGLGLKSTMYSLAESGVFGGLKEVRKENFWEVILRMYDIVKRDKDEEARQKSNKNE